MTAATTKIERSGPATRAALARHALGECAEFERVFLEALNQVSELDLRPVEAVLDQWWGQTAILANPLSQEEQELVARAGDDASWVVHHEDGDRTSCSGSSRGSPCVLGPAGLRSLARVERASRYVAVDGGAA